MANDPVTALKDWFDELARSEQKDVLAFLYEGYLVNTGTGYLGPDPKLAIKGLYCGPAPSRTSTSNVCPTCGRPR